MVTIKFKVTGQSLKLIEHKRFVAASDTINYFRCRVRFAEDWDIYTDRSIYFKNMSSDICKPGVFNDDGYCFVPWEVLANTGVIIASAVGVVMDGEEIAERLTTFPVELFVQVEEGQISVQPNEDPTPSQYEQFIANVQEYSEAAIQAKIRANNFAINAEASAGQAEASKNLAATSAQNASRSAAAANTSAVAAELAESRVEDMSVSSETLSPGAAASVEKTETSESFNLHFGLPRGEAGPQGPQGIQGDKGDTGLQGIQGEIGATGPPRTWGTLEGKPSTFPPSTHSHDDRYYTEVETDAAIGEETQRATQRENEIEGEIPDVINGVTSTSTEDALSANMGKELQAQITNLKNLGRFCAIWRADTGLPTSQPAETPYDYKVGDYFRIGATGYRVPTGSTYVQGAYDTVAEETGIGDVWYYDGTLWKKQVSSGGGAVQDVQVNTVSVLYDGIAEIIVPTALEDLSADATHRLVTDTEKALWNSKTKVTISTSEPTSADGADGDIWVKYEV